MRLKKLVVQGFKSFKDRTTVNFDQNITGIVGPNGCGKSNIVDALFWVMGEQSAKHLRGDTMKDVIFAGSSKYTSSSWAEVALVLENEEKKHIHIGNKVSNPTDIQISRKLYRNGESEYRINGTPCRLRDIQEVFMDTGAGAKSYSIIAQGEIERLVRAKPEERRMMIEEVAGITKFKKRKKESLRKVEQTKYNLGRLSDIQTEIEKNLDNLKEQSQKAERAMHLKETITDNELIVNSQKVCGLLREMREVITQLSQTRLDLENWRTRKDALEVSLEGERIKKDDLISLLDEFQRIFNELSKELAASEARAEYLETSKSEKNLQKEKRSEECDEIILELQETGKRLEQLQEEKNELERKLQEEHDFSDQEERVEFLKSELEAKEDVEREIRSVLEHNRTQKQDIDQKLFQNTSRQGELAANLQDVTAEIEALEKQYSGISTEISEQREEVLKAEENTKELTSREENLKNCVKELEERYSGLETDNKRTLKESIVAESRLNSLIEINAALEGVKEGSAEFLKNDNSGNFEILGNLVQCGENYTKAVQSLLVDFLETMVSDTDDVRLLLDWHSNNTDKGLDLLVGSPTQGKNTEETLERLKIQLSSCCNWDDGEETVIPLREVITLPAGYSERILHIFDGYFLVNKLNKESFEGIDSGIKFKALASLDGDVVIRNFDGGKLLSLGSCDDFSHGIIDRNNEINELESRLSEIKANFLEQEKNLEECKRELDASREEHDVVRNNLAEMRAEFAAKKSSLDSKTSNFEIGSTRLEIQKNRKNEVSRQRLGLLEDQEQLDSLINELNQVIESKTGELSEVSEQLQNIKVSYEHEKEDLLTRKVEANSLMDRLNTAISRVEDFDKQIQKNEEKLLYNRNLIEEFSSEIIQINDEYDTLSCENKNKAEDLSCREENMSSHKDQLAQLLSAMQEREDEIKILNKNINNNEKKIISVEARHEQNIFDEEQLVRNIFEKYQINLREVIGRYFGYTDEEYSGLKDLSSMNITETEEGPKEIESKDYEFNVLENRDVKKSEERLRKAKNEYHLLGDINWQAIEDFKRQKMRFDFLKEQEEELLQSLEDLEKAIEHIDVKSKERFKTAFHEVSERFQNVFPIIFGGGSALLKITGDSDDPECGVDIVAQPPGKKMQNINLMSGGEKALTAVSLIFSIFLVKPSPFCLLDEVDAPLDDANVGRFNELLREMSHDSQFILITHNKKTMEMNDALYGITMEEPGISKAVSVQLQ
ncbi:MAG: chromosome segregation protein SMC [Bacteriovoracaceae bacterium]|nr:chromosome segregation protein SMC [Bacteriovoracaceae bacterium]